MARPRTIGAVIAGGRSTRIGRPKASIELRGQPLIEYPLASLEQAGIESVVVAKRGTPLPELTVPVWREPDQPAHPLCGIVAALEHANGRAVVVCGCDMPFLEPALLSALAKRDESLAVPLAGGRLHPLVARYTPALLDSLRAALDSRRPLQEIVAELEPAVIEDEELRRYGDPKRLLFNVNTIADLEEAERLIDADEGGPVSRRGA
jgi:molybdopterin-guanine dinucleotide biosynthesis protein A